MDRICLIWILRKPNDITRDRTNPILPSVPLTTGSINTQKGWNRIDEYVENPIEAFGTSNTVLIAYFLLSVGSKYQICLFKIDQKMRQLNQFLEVSQRVRTLRI